MNIEYFFASGRRCLHGALTYMSGHPSIHLPPEQMNCMYTNIMIHGCCLHPLSMTSKDDTTRVLNNTTCLFSLLHCPLSQQRWPQKDKQKKKKKNNKEGSWTQREREPSRIERKQWARVNYCTVCVCGFLLSVQVESVKRTKGKTQRQWRGWPSFHFSFLSFSFSLPNSFLFFFLTPPHSLPLPHFPFFLSTVLVHISFTHSNTHRNSPVSPRPVNQQTTRPTNQTRASQTKPNQAKPNNTRPQHNTSLRSFLTKKDSAQKGDSRADRVNTSSQIHSNQR